MTGSPEPAGVLDVEAVRADFPALDGGTAFFDGPGGSQTPTAVADAIHDAMLAPLSNRGHATAAARNAEAIVVECRTALADLLGADPDEVIFGRSMTALTFDLSRTLSTGWHPGDEVVVTRLDHDANVRPWVIAAEAAGATVRWVDFDPDTSELDVAAVAAQLSDRTRLVAVTAASNLIGTMPDVRAIADLTHAAGALLYVDGVHYARTPSSTSVRSAPTSSPARRTSSWAHTVGWWPVAATCWPGCDPPSCCRPPTGCPSASNWARSLTK